MDNEELIKKIIKCAQDVRKQLPAGLEESVYRSALLIEFKENGIDAETDVLKNILYKNTIVGEVQVDILAANSIIVEIEAVKHMPQEHEKQLRNILKATDTEHGLLINFGGEELEIKRKDKTPKEGKDIYYTYVLVPDDKTIGFKF